MAAKIKKGDYVVVIAGKDKGQKGEVLKVFPRESRVVVKGIKMVKRHVRPSQADPDGGIKQFEAPIHVSNVAHIDPKDNKPTRVGFKTLKDGQKVRIRAKMKEQFGYKNEMQIPRVDKIVLNMGLGEGVSDKKKVEAAINELELIAGQKPLATRSKKSIAGFKLRDGMVIGAKVTLRRDKMFEFMDRLVNIAEHIVFPEIDYDKVDQVRGMDIVVQTSARTDEEAKALLAAFAFPFRN